jgi:hypothetical protein
MESLNNTAMLFLSDLTVVDHAVIMPDGSISGGSFNPGFLVEGKVVGDEQVVVDFSKVKKQIKESIDKHTSDPHTNGFDHKLWIIDGFSNGQSISQFVSFPVLESENRVYVHTDSAILTLSVDAVRIISNPGDAYDLTDESEYCAFIGHQMALHVQEDLRKLHPNIDIVVTCKNNTTPHVIDHKLDVHWFKYSHGLRFSSSYGCQNVCHGHLSFIQSEDSLLAKQVADELNDAVFISKENVAYETDTIISIQYETPDRGYFSASYKKDVHNIVVLETETTIELIANYVSAKYNIHDFYISEGLSKGVYYKIASN